MNCDLALKWRKWDGDLYEGIVSANRREIGVIPLGSVTRCVGGYSWFGRVKAGRERTRDAAMRAVEEEVRGEMGEPDEATTP